MIKTRVTDPMVGMDLRHLPQPVILGAAQSAALQHERITAFADWSERTKFPRPGCPPEKPPMSFLSSW